MQSQCEMAFSCGDSEWKNDVDFKKLVHTMCTGTEKEVREYLENVVLSGNCEQTPFLTILKEKIEDEIFHIAFVRKCGFSNHDHSKGANYILSTIMHSSLRAKVINIKDILDDHYRQEDHHPGHSLFSEKPISDAGIHEMAVDRLSRNLQFNGGEINKGQMEQFQPKYLSCPRKTCTEECEHQSELISRYYEFVEMRENDVISLWQDLFPQRHSIVAEFLSKWYKSA